MKRMYTPIAALVLGCTAIGNPALAGAWTDRITLGGFASANYSRTNDEVPFDGEENVGADDKGSWSGTNIGLNINAQVNDRFRVASQIFASKAEKFNAKIDWAFGELALTEAINVRAGKIKFPVGILNEYADVGYTMPWLKPPAVIYSELGLPNGPQVTREGYTGASLLGNLELGDWVMSADLFAGEIQLETSSVRQLGGISVDADWDDVVLLQGSYNRGVMHGTGEALGGIMEGTAHQSTVLGIKADWNNILLYAERGDVDMGNDSTMETLSWYTTLGYQMGDWLPHVTYQDYKKSLDGVRTDDQNILTVGLRWDFMPDVALKVELSRINTDMGVGLFMPEEATTAEPDPTQPGSGVNMIGFGLDTIF